MPRTELDALSLALEQGGAPFRAVANAMPQLVWTSMSDGSIEFFNDRWVEYTGHTVDDARGGLPGVVHPDDAGETTERWLHAVQTQQPFEIEYRLRNAADGTYRWFLARAVPVRDGAGNIRLWIGTATDIDAQKRANESLNFVLDASSALSSASDVGRICGEFARMAVRQFADWCVVLLSDDSGGYAVTAIEHRNPAKVRYVRQYIDRYPVSADTGFTSILERKETILFPRITEEMLVQSALDDEHLKLLHSLDMQSAIVAPLYVEDRVLGGVILYTAESRRAFTQPDVNVVDMLTQRTAAAIERARTLAAEQRLKRRLQLINRATEIIFESLDLTSTFGELVRLIAATFGGFAVAVRVEREGAVRVVGAAHSDEAKDDMVRSLVGVRPFHPEAENKFIQSLRPHQTIVRDLTPEVVARSMWPYLAGDAQSLTPASSVTIPLHSRGNTYGAIIAYSSDREQTFTSEEIETLSDIGRHASVAMENAEVFERERRMAETLQDSLLPPSLPRLKGLRFDAVYLPSASGAQVGGDWYDAFVLEDGSIVVSVGDVTGRGPDAAVIMGKTRHLIAIAPSYERDPARIFDTVESVLARRYPDAIVTAFIGIIDPSRTTMRYANAGHPLPLLRGKDDVEELRAEGLPLGLRAIAEPSQSHEVSLNGAKMLVLYTDGLVESSHDVIEGHRRLHEVVRSEAVLHTHSPARFIEELCLHGDADDDLAVLTLSFDPSVRWAFDAENAKAAQDARGQFVRYLRNNAADPETIDMAELIFGELVGNVVRHSPGAIDVDVDWSGEYPKLHVLDRGAEFGMSDGLPKDVLSESGRGLFIVDNLSRSMRIERVPGYGNHVTVELPLRRKLE